MRGFSGFLFVPSYFSCCFGERKWVVRGAGYRAEVSNFEKKCKVTSSSALNLDPRREDVSQYWSYGEVLIPEVSFNASSTFNPLQHKDLFAFLKGGAPIVSVRSKSLTLHPFHAGRSLSDI